MAAKKSPFNPKIIIVVVILLVVGIGAFFLMGKKDSNNSSTATGDNAFTSIKDALSKSLSLQCEFNQDGIESMVYIKNGAMRGDFVGASTEETGSVIVKDNKTYYWNEEGGYVMTMPEVQGDIETSESSPSQGEDFLKDIEEYKDSCKPAVVSDSLFTPPGDVTFTDMSTMMDGMQHGTGMTEQEMQQMMEQYQTEE